MTVQVSYRPQSEDTSVEADQLLFQLLRQQPVGRRVEIAAQHSRGINRLCLSGVKRRNPNATLPVMREKFAIAKLGRLPQGLILLGEDEEMWIQDSITLARDLDRIFEHHGILYYVTGGVAASTHGEPRATRDLDLVVQILTADIDEMAAILTAEGFYCPEGALDEVRRGIRSYFQATHTIGIANVDIYISDGSAFANSQLSRRMRIAEGFYVCSPEDIVLQKLLWRKTSQSEKQWRDVLGVLKLQQQDLDSTYLREWATELNVLADLTRAMQEAGESNL